MPVSRFLIRGPVLTTGLAIFGGSLESQLAPLHLQRSCWSLASTYMLLLVHLKMYLGEHSTRSHGDGDADRNECPDSFLLEKVDSFRAERRRATGPCALAIVL